MNKVLTFTEGMFENTNDLMLNDQQAASILNMSFNGANMENMPALTADTFITGLDRIIKWRSANKISAANSNENYVCLDGATLKIYYPTGSGYMAHSTTFSLTSAADFFYDSSPEQFVFVDGKNGNQARRIVIDDLGVLSILKIGIESPLYPASLVSLTMDQSAESGAGTGLPAGVNIQYVHTDLNEYGEESNPSPILSINNACNLIRGQVNDGVVEVDSFFKGETVKTDITARLAQGLSKKRLYRRWSPYCESNIPFTRFALVNDYQFNKVTAEYAEVDMIDSFTDQPFSANYERDIASSADDILLFDGTVVIGNTKKDIKFLNEPTTCWEIILTNSNSFNYVDQVVSIDIFDNTFSAVSGITTNDYINVNLGSITNFESKFAFCHSDRITPINALSYGLDSFNPQFRNGSSTSFKHRWRVDLKVPYLPAGQSTTIYLLYFSGSTADTIFEDTLLNIDGIASAHSVDVDHCYLPIRPLSYDNHICYSCQEDSTISTMVATDNNANNNLKPTYNYFIKVADSNDFTLYNTYTPSDYYHYQLNKLQYGLTQNTSADYNIKFERTKNNIKVDDKITVSFFMTLHESSTISTSWTALALIGKGWRDDDYAVLQVRKVAGTPSRLEMAVVRYGETDGTNNFTVISDISNSDIVSLSMFICLSLDTTLLDKITPTNSTTDASVHVLSFTKKLIAGQYYTTNNYVTQKVTLAGFGLSDDTLGFYLYKNSAYPLNTPSNKYSQISVVLNKYYDSATDYGKQRFLALAAHLPDYPVSPIGLYFNTTNYYTKTDNYPKNSGVLFRELSLSNSSYKDGYLVFGSEYIPDLNEINLNEKILRLAKLPSFQADSDMNTIIAFCENNIYRVYLNKNQANYQIASELQSVALLSKRGLATSNRNLYFLTNDGIMQYGKDGIANLSKFKVKNVISFERFFYSEKDRILKCWHSTLQLWYYVDYNLFVYCDNRINTNDKALEIADKHNKDNFYINDAFQVDDSSYIITTFKNHTTTKLDGKIITGKIPARDKLRTLYAPKASVVKLNLYSDLLTGGQSLLAKTISLTAYKKFHPANVKADYITMQIEIDKSIKSFDYLAVETGGK